MRKKLLVLLLSLVLCVSLLPIGAMAAVNGSGILLVMVGDTQVTDKNASDVLGDGTVSYDSASNTLKLNNAIVGTIVFEGNYSQATIEFTGNNKVDGSIVSWGDLTFRGSGVLDVIDARESDMAAIASQDQIIFESGTVNISSGYGYSINTLYNVRVQGSAEVNIVHQSASVAINSNGTLYVSGNGRLKVENNRAFNAINARAVDVSGGKLDVVASGSQGKALSVGYQLNISGGEVILSAAGDYAAYCDGDISISGGNLDAYSGGVTSDTYEIHAGIYSEYKLNISGGIVTVKAESDYAVAVGYEDLNIHDCVFTSTAKAVGRSIEGKVNVNNCWLDCSSYEGIDTSNNVVFNGTAGTVEGSAKAPDGAVVPAGATLTVPEGSTLTVPEGSTLTVEAGATMTNNGKVVIDGTLDNEGIYYENGETEGLVSGGGQMPNNWVVTLDYGFGDVVKYYNVIKGENTTLPDADRSGYAFLGWQCGGESYSAGDSVKVDGNMTLPPPGCPIPTRALFPALAGHRAARRSPGQPESKPTELEPKPETPAVDFGDVTASDWYYEAVEYVAPRVSWTASRRAPLPRTAR